MRHAVLLAAATVGSLAATAAAQADPMYVNEPIVAVFGDGTHGDFTPVLSGNLLNDPNVGQSTFSTSTIPFYAYANGVEFVSGAPGGGVSYSSTVYAPFSGGISYGVGWPSTPNTTGTPLPPPPPTTIGPGCIPNPTDASGSNCGNTSGGGSLAFSGGAPAGYTGPASAVQWGAYTASSVPGYSELDFFGASVPADMTDPFQVGTLTFHNGTSYTGTAIYGVSVSFYAGDPILGNFLGTDQIVINTTLNNGNPTQDVDWINVCGSLSNICGDDIAAIEDSEGGMSVTVDLNGALSGDPTLTLTSVVLAPGQSPNTNGFIGSAGPLAAEVPEPASLTLLGSSLFALALARRRKRTPG